MDSIIEVKRLNCKVGHRFLLKEVTWNIKKGEQWVVFGMNGSGKTTLLSIIAGFRHFTDGTLKVFGENFSNENILEMRKQIGWVSASFFDKYYTKESITDIVLSGKFGTFGIDGEITTADIKAAKLLLAELGMKRQSEYTFDMLSKGERQNVLIARALFSKPKILVLDEPCTGLDIYNREYLFQTLEKLIAKTDLTIIYVTHYIEDIKPMFNMCLLLKNGQVFSKGRTAEIFNNQEISSFLEHPVMIEKNSEEQMYLKVLDVKSNLEQYFV